MEKTWTVKLFFSLKKVMCLYIVICPSFLIINYFDSYWKSMIDPSSSEEDSDEDQKEPVAPPSGNAARGHHAEPPSQNLDVPHPGSHRSLSPSTASSDTLNVGHQGSLGSGSGASTISAGGTPLRGSALPRPTSPSPSLISEKTVTDPIDPQVIPFSTWMKQYLHTCWYIICLRKMRAVVPYQFDC